MIRSVSVSPFQVNCWLLVCPATGETAIIDSGDDVADILSALDEMGEELGKPLKIKFLLHTHAHLDHFGATRELYEAVVRNENSRGKSVPVIALHPEDGNLWQELCSQGRMFGLDYEPPIPVTHLLKDGEEIAVGKLKLTVLHTPGHSPGGTCFFLHSDPELKIQATLFSGDTLFQGSIGRTDLWGGDLDALIGSIRHKLFKLPDATRVCCGHGPDTQIGREKRGNPFIPKS